MPFIKSTAPFGSPLAGLPFLRDAASRRVSSWDRTGGNADFVTVAPGDTALLGELAGPGCVRHIWITSKSDDQDSLRKIILRIFWDGEPTPSVECPLGDFFGVGHARVNHFASLPVNMVTGPRVIGNNRAAMNCFFPMPFAESARLEVRNDSELPVDHLYFNIDYETYGSLDERLGRFHAQWRQENPTEAASETPVTAVQPSSPERSPTGLQNQIYPEKNLSTDQNYVILDAEGWGHYVGCLLNVTNVNAFHQGHPWFGEGDDMIVVDGEPWPPRLHGTGTEDYFLAAWGFPGMYSMPYHGVTCGDDAWTSAGQWSMYRFHVEDPVCFRESIRVTIEHGHANNQCNDYSSVAYWYQAEPHKPFPAFSVGD